MVGTRWEQVGTTIKSYYQLLKMFPLCSHYVPTMFPLLYLNNFMFNKRKKQLFPLFPLFEGESTIFGRDGGVLALVYSYFGWRRK